MPASHDYTLLYTPDAKGGALRLKQFAAALKNDTVTPRLQDTCRRDFMVWLGILGNMILKYENVAQFEREFPEDLILSRRRNPSNMRHFEAFFSLSEETHGSTVSLFFPAVGGAAAAPRLIPLTLLLAEVDNYHTPNL